MFTQFAFSQTEQSVLSNPNLIKHQVGIGISKFVNSAFSSDKNAYAIEYRYEQSQKTAWRAGLSYEKDDSESGFINGGIKVGIDRNLRKYDYWTIYYGIDFLGNYSNYKNINKNQYNFGLAPLLGIQYRISKNFSVSIEPMIYVMHTIVIDNATFEKNKTTRWTESGLGKLGYIQLNFHF